MQVTLMENGKEKVYVSGFISGMIFRKAIQMEKQVQENGISVELLDDLVGFIVEIFNDQFTLEQFYSGIAAKDMLSTIIDIVRNCINGALSQEKH